MLKTFKVIFDLIFPENFKKKIQRNRRFNKIRNKIFDFYNKSDIVLSEEQKVVLRYLKKYNVKVYPYSHLDKYDSFTIEILTDKSKNLNYVLYNNKKLYFPKNMSDDKIKSVHRQLLKEQDDRSPHKYLTENFDVNDGDTVFDVGGAEGIFSLSIIERAGRVFLFEPDTSWNDALKATFEPWQHKIQIINKFVSDFSDGKTVKIDDLIKPSDADSVFIKIDTEGYDQSVLKGAIELITKSKCKIAVCTYHKQNDENELKALLEKSGYKTHVSDGYMIRWYDPLLCPPYFRRGLIRAESVKR